MRAGLNDAAIVARENDKRFLREHEAVERRKHLSHRLVKLGKGFSGTMALQAAVTTPPGERFPVYAVSCLKFVGDTDLK